MGPALGEVKRTCLSQTGAVARARQPLVKGSARHALAFPYTPKCGQLVRRFAVLRDFGPTLRAMAVFCAVFVTARFATGFAAFAAFALPAAFVAGLDLTVFVSFAGADFVAVFFVTRDAGRVSTVGEVSS
jgi:hypothetical protein